MTNNPLLLNGNLGNILRFTRSNPFPDVIGTFMGRDALSLLVYNLNLYNDDVVLLPAYLCGEVLKPFLAKNRVEYYELGPELSVDPQEIMSKISKYKVKAMLIINYFGFLQPYRKEIKNICKERSVILIEDCAHSLLTEGSGETGDIATYSFRKILPLPDGGGLKMNINLEIKAKFYPKIFTNIISLFILVKLLLNIRSDVFSRSGISSKKRNIFPSTNSGKIKNIYFPLSSFAYNGVGNASFADIIKKRRDDYLLWQRMNERTNLFTPVFGNLLPGVCPLGFPVKIYNRDLLKVRLQKEGVYLKTHWHLPEEVGREFVHSRNLSKQTVTLPVYPDIGIRGRKAIEEALNTMYSKK